MSLHRPSQCINDLASEAPHSQVISKERETNKSKLATQEEPRLVLTTNYKHDKFLLRETIPVSSANDVQNHIEGKIVLLVAKQKYTSVGRMCLGKEKSSEPVSKSVNHN